MRGTARPRAADHGGVAGQADRQARAEARRRTAGVTRKPGATTANTPQIEHAKRGATQPLFPRNRRPLAKPAISPGGSAARGIAANETVVNEYLQGKIDDVRRR